MFLKDSTLWKAPTLEQFMKNCCPREGLVSEKFMEDCLSWERPHAGAGRRVCGVLPLVKPWSSLREFI